MLEKIKVWLWLRGYYWLLPKTFKFPEDKP